jgi:hypothetical protein
MTSTTVDHQTRRRVLVTDGAVRVGRALALAEAGMDVAIAYHASARQAASTVRELRARGARAVAIRADLRQPGAARALVDRAVRALGGLDVLVNNAALFYRTPLTTTTLAQYDAMRVAPGPVLKPERLPAARWSVIRRGGGDGVTAVAAAVVSFSTCAADVTGQVLPVEGDAALLR